MANNKQKNAKKLIPVGRPAPTPAPQEDARFSVSPIMVSFVTGCFAALLIPYYASGFWLASLDMFAGAALAPQAIFLGVTSLLCLFVGMAGRSADEKWPKSDVAFFLVAFLVLYAISLIAAQYRHDAIIETARIGGILCWFFVVREWFRKLDPAKFATYLLFFISCITVGAIIAVIPALVNFVQTRNPRQFGAFYNPNLLANFCAMAAPLAAGGALYAARLSGNFRTMGKVLSFLFWISALLILGGLIVTSSKGGLLALIIAAIVFFASLKKARRAQKGEASGKRAFITAILSLVIAVAVIALLTVTVLPRIAAGIHDDHSSMFRWFTWIGTIKMALAKPILGWGPASFPDVFPLFAVAGYTRSAHESWLQIAAENGWPAMIILVIVCGAAFRAGWRALNTSRYPVAAGALAALTAFAVHGLVDAGWGIISVAWLLIVALSILVTLETTPETPEPLPKATSLNWPWLAGAVLLGGLSWVTQQTSQAEDLRAQSMQQLQENPQEAVKTAQSAINADPGNRRMWDNLGRIQWSLGENAEKSYRKAIELEPFRAAGYFDLARYLQNTDPLRYEKEIGELFDNAIIYDHHDTTLRMARAQWRIKHDDARGWDDLRYIVNLLREPYGKYPAVPEIVDFNYGAAAIMLAKHELDQNNPTAAQPFLQIAGAQLEAGRNYVNSNYQQQILESVGQSNQKDSEKLADMEADYAEQKERLQAAESAKKDQE